SAAKNFKDVAVVVSPLSYDDVIDELQRQGGALSLDGREELAASAFLQISAYDGAISEFFSARQAQMYVRDRYPAAKDRKVAAGSGPGTLPEVIHHWFTKITDLRYGENPHQAAALYTVEEGGVTSADLLNGKEMSFNNYVDADAAWQLVCDFNELACAIIKHTNPAGVALGSTIEEAYRKALACDPVSAFGGIVAFNRPVDENAARAVSEIFTEVLIAPDFEQAALEILKPKKNLRVLRTAASRNAESLEYKQISGGMLVQTSDTHRLKREDLKVVTKRAPTDKE